MTHLDSFSGVRVACEAMATRFEILLPGADAPRLRAAGEEAMAEIRRIDARLSYFRPTSEISRINLGAANGPVRVSPSTFRLLLLARRLYQASDRSFDVTIAPLMHCWGFRGGSASRPRAEAIEDARQLVGMELVELDEGAHTVRFQRSGVRLDLGAIGKGYALDEAAQLLREAGISSALLHGGTSSVQTIGGHGDDEWRVGIDYPVAKRDPAERIPLSVVALRDTALSVSGVRGRWFSNGSHVYGHVIDPRTGMPATNGLLAAVVANSATTADALSTALLTLGLPEYATLTATQPSLPMLLVAERDPSGALTVAHREFPVFPAPALGRIDSVRM